MSSHSHLAAQNHNLLIVPEEHLDWQPVVTADLESILKPIQLGHLITGQLPTIKLKVCLDTVLVDRLGDH